MHFTTKLVWISDTHLTGSGMVEGVACQQRLAQAVEQIRLHHGDAIACIGTGDLADKGEPEAYAMLADAVAGLPMPFLPMTGNHDNREEFRRVFPPPGEAMPDYQQFRWDVGELTLLCLDTLSPGEDGGRLDEARIGWLEHQLHACAGQRVLVFMHHPPARLGLGLQDDIMLHDEGRLISVLNRARHVEYLFCGHVHRPVCGVIAGVPFTTLRALAHQTRPAYALTDWNDFVAPDERPQYGVILIGPNRIVIQANDLEDAA
ncbi:MAG: metallophosphoesterase [Rhizobiaceae bacterium]